MVVLRLTGLPDGVFLAFSVVASLKVADRVLGLLVAAKTWLTADQITERLGAKRRDYIHWRLMKLADDGLVERRRPNGREIEWRAV